jgi:hypothetical protein
VAVTLVLETGSSDNRKREIQMDFVDDFEELIASLTAQFAQVFIDYAGPPTKFRACVNARAKAVAAKFYGVYVVRQRDTGEVLYIGKGGTLGEKGCFKDQDVFRRLKNVKSEKGHYVSADCWFGNLVRERGPIRIDCFSLTPARSPAFIEAALLQAYLNTYKRLPYKNNEL